MHRLLALAALALAAACASFATLEPDRVASLSLRPGGGGQTVCINDPGAHPHMK